MTSGADAADAQLRLMAVLRRRGLSVRDTRVELDGLRCLLGPREVWEWLADLLTAEEVRVLWPGRDDADPAIALDAVLDALGALLDSGEMVAEV
jgi:hypothetical protein